LSHGKHVDGVADPWIQLFSDQPDPWDGFPALLASLSLSSSSEKERERRGGVTNRLKTDPWIKRANPWKNSPTRG
jgi:hypothetical protein